ncbi:hypothetical protein MJG53_009679 [Ovis ammon polii x Ovis aries]|uniref:Uncharacterized protein n=1 Tax=Ovis ammon polii x Ovis aries TaxID=2918886 RepID=A0ACB9UWU1_9CETA|nr:hypothetical protein MJG53_009679 [Ovis ammon polii x Ovis aries]
MLARLLQKSADSRVPASSAEPREAAASRRCHSGWRLLSGTVSFVVTSVETERPKAATAHLPRSWEVRNRYTEEGGRASRGSPRASGRGCVTLNALHELGRLPEVSLEGENWLHAPYLFLRSAALPGS